MFKVLILATGLSVLALPQLTTLKEGKTGSAFKQIIENMENVLLCLSYVSWGASEVPILKELWEMQKWVIYKCPSLELILAQDRLQGKNDVPLSIS